MRSANSWLQQPLVPGVQYRRHGRRTERRARRIDQRGQVPNLSDNLMEHYLALPAAAPANAFALGKQYHFQLIYEHSAAGTAATNPD